MDTKKYAHLYDYLYDIFLTNMSLTRSFSFIAKKYTNLELGNVLLTDLRCAVIELMQF
jgi:hypothetical protein